MVRKYTVRPSRSLMVVMKGPDATAGLNPNRSRINGVIVPINEAKTTTLNKAIETIRES